MGHFQNGPMLQAIVWLAVLLLGIVNAQTTPKASPPTPTEPVPIAPVIGANTPSPVRFKGTSNETSTSSSGESDGEGVGLIVLIAIPVGLATFLLAFIAGKATRKSQFNKKRQQFSRSRDRDREAARRKARGPSRKKKVKVKKKIVKRPSPAKKKVIVKKTVRKPKKIIERETEIEYASTFTPSEASSDRSSAAYRLLNEGSIQGLSVLAEDYSGSVLNTALDPVDEMSDSGESSYFSEDDDSSVGSSVRSSYSVGGSLRPSDSVSCVIQKKG